MPMDMLPEMSSAIPPTRTMRVVAMAASPADRPKGTCRRHQSSALCALNSSEARSGKHTVSPSESPRMISRTTSGSSKARSSSPFNVLQHTASGRACTSHIAFRGGWTVPYELPPVLSDQTGSLSLASLTESVRFGSFTEAIFP
jgi:hypothetical protein